MTGRPAVFLDRDGTLNVEVDYLADPARFELIPGAAEGLARLAAILQKIRERRRSTAHHLDIAFPDDFEDLSAHDEPQHSPLSKSPPELPGPLRV